MDDAREWLASAPAVSTETPARPSPGDPWAPREAGVRSPGHPAGVWLRALALVVDGVAVGILSAVGAGLGQALTVLGPGTVLVGQAFDISWQVVVPTAYFVLGHGTDGRTLGKRLVGLRVVDVRDERIGYLHALGRSLAWGLAALPLGLGLVAAALRADRRGLHDLLAGTKVVRER